MSPFAYIRDPLCLAAIGAYALNRWLLKPVFHSPFLQGHFADLLMIPAALPVVLGMQRLFRLREDDRPPSWAEMAAHLALWAFICEGLGPRWLHMGVADTWDLAAYALGGVAACLWWNRSARAPLCAPASRP